MMNQDLIDAVNILKQSKKDVKEGDFNADKLENELDSALAKVQGQYNKFPYGISADQEMKKIEKEVADVQHEVTEEFIEEAPRRRFENEWSQPDLMDAFIEEVSREIGKRVADAFIEDYVRDMLEDRYRRIILYKNTFKNFEELYEFVKAGKHKEDSDG